MRVLWHALMTSVDERHDGIDAQISRTDSRSNSSASISEPAKDTSNPHIRSCELSSSRLDPIRLQASVGRYACRTGGTYDSTPDETNLNLSERWEDAASLQLALLRNVNGRTPVQLHIAQSWSPAARCRLSRFSAGNLGNCCATSRHDDMGELVHWVRSVPRQEYRDDIPAMETYTHKRFVELTCSMCACTCADPDEIASNYDNFVRCRSAALLRFPWDPRSHPTHMLTTYPLAKGSPRSRDNGSQQRQSF